MLSHFNHIACLTGWLAFLAIRAFADDSCPPGNLGPMVTTSSGTIIGHPAPKFPNVTRFLGVPFAKPPVESLRFAPPEPFKSTKTIDAKHQPQSCVQPPAHLNYSWPENFFNIQDADSSYANHTSEDCLYLDVYTASTKSDKLKPVIVWLYGGGFHAGGIADDSQGGAIYAANHDVVFVKPNYRLGIFGFPGALDGEQNLGLLDQRLALEWVRDNIKNFGGDPTKTMLYGHSAGGASVDYHSYAWKDDPIFSSAIIMSGTTTSFGNRLPNTTAAGWVEAAKLLGCSGQAAQVKTCMQSKPAEQILAASLNATKLVISTLDSTSRLYAGITGIFGPTIDNKTVFYNYTALGSQGHFAKVPYLLGSSDGEGCFFVEAGTAPADALTKVTEVVFSCPIYHQAAFRAMQGLKTWKYLYEGSYPNLDLPVCPGQAWHGQEEYVMSNSAAYTSKQASTQAELDQGAYMRRVWTAFAHDPENALGKEFGWPSLAQGPNGTNTLGVNGSVHSFLPDAETLNGPCKSQLTQGAPNF